MQKKFAIINNYNSLADSLLKKEMKRGGYFAFSFAQHPSKTGNENKRWETMWKMATSTTILNLALNENNDGSITPKLLH